MVFSSMLFLWGFFPIVFIITRLCPVKYHNIILLTASLLFYAWGEPIYILLMIFSIALNWSAGILVEKYSEYKMMSRGILAADIIVNLCLLGYFKYFNFFVDIFNSISGKMIIGIREIALPIGISFYTFQAMSYVIDLYRNINGGNIKAQKNILKLALYISFFPQLIAGPIVKYKDINEQLSCRSIISFQVTEGMRRFTYGLSKKVIIANSAAQYADRIFSLPLEHISGQIAWMGALLYTLQIYFDFSGYSDMAIGLGKIFGFEFLENFNYPYISKSIQEFWRRWHISLSSWFKEYVYIPLGGNRKGKIRTYLNLIIVFLCTGLWHGASLNYVVWGLYHGFFLIIERMGLKNLLDRFKVFNWIYSMIIVMIGWMLFRLEDMWFSLRYIKRMLMPWLYMDSPYSLMELLTPKTIFIVGLGIASAGLLQNMLCEKSRRMKNSFLEWSYCTVLLFICILMLAGNTYNPFIYFRF